MKIKLMRAILVSLLQCAGQPMPEAALVTAAQILCRPDEPTDDDVLDKLKDCRALGLVFGETNEITSERSWTLTDKGSHQAKKMR
jgi:hypothetical protein